MLLYRGKEGIATDDLQLNVPLLRRRVPNLTVAAKGVGLRPATVSDLCTGKIPLGRAEVRTLVALADLAGCSLDELVLRGAGIGMIETGIKVIDLFAPLVRGGTVGLVARPGVGKMVILQELFRRLRMRGYATFLFAPTDYQLHPDFAEILPETDGVSDDLERSVSSIAALREQHDVVVAADRSAVLSGELAALRERLHVPGTRPVTFTLVDALGEAPDEDVPYGPLETLWRFDTDLAARGIYPAVDPVASASTLLEGAQLESTHLTVYQRARKVLRRYREWLPLVRVRGVEKLPPAELTGFHRGERLEAFLSQPLYVAEPFTRRAGAWVSPAEAVEDIRRILDGAADETPVEALKYIGRLEPARPSPGGGDA